MFFFFVCYYEVVQMLYRVRLREIYKIADARTMCECWPGFHTLDDEMAIDGTALSFPGGMDIR